MQLYDNLAVSHHYNNSQRYTSFWNETFIRLSRDLRGNLFSCDCKLKWLVDWMIHTNATVDEIYCSGPEAYQGKKINDLEAQSFDCITTGWSCSLRITLRFFKWKRASCLSVCSTDFPLLKSLEFQSISVEAFAFGGDQFVVFAQPFIGKCSFMEWDHVQMEFRNFDNITSKKTEVEMLHGVKVKLYT